MKMFHAMFVLVFALTGFARERSAAFLDAMRNGAMANIKLRVVDDDAQPVSWAKVRVFMGMNFRDRGYWLEGTTDTKGDFVIDGKTTGNEIEIYLFKEGYYESKRRLCFIGMGAEHEVSDGKWQPWGSEEKVVLRRIKNPIRLIQAPKGCFENEICKTNVNLGFDMKVGDWVIPYGKGVVADFYAKFQSDGGKPMNSKFSALELTFSEPMGGAYCLPVNYDSEFKGVYIADLSKFSNSKIVLENKVINGQRMRKMIDDEFLVVRSRCKVNERGELTSANYSVLRHLTFSTSYTALGCCRMSYMYNPTPNDTNLEDEETARLSRLKYAQRLECESRCKGVKKR